MLQVIAGVYLLLFCVGVYPMDDQQRSNAQIREAYLAAQQRRALQAGVGSAADAQDAQAVHAEYSTLLERRGSLSQGLPRIDVQQPVGDQADGAHVFFSADEALLIIDASLEQQMNDDDDSLESVVKRDNVGLLLSLQERGIDATEALSMACHHGSFEIVRHLVEQQGAQFEPVSLIVAASQGHAEIIRYAHECEQLDEQTRDRCVQEACEKGHVETVRCLAEACGVILGRQIVMAEGGVACPLEIVCSKGHLPLVQYLFDMYVENTQRALGRRGERMSPEALNARVLQVFETRKQVGSRKCMLCNKWIHRGVPAVVDIELEFCRENHPERIESHDRKLPSLLHRACLGGHKDVAQYLIAMGASIEGAFDSTAYHAELNALHCACLSGNVDLVVYIREILDLLHAPKKNKSGLFKKLFKPFMRNNAGPADAAAHEDPSFLHIAARKSSWSVVRYLLGHAPEGADWASSRDVHGRSLSMCAALAGNTGVLNGLMLEQLKLCMPREHGAHPVPQTLQEHVVEIDAFLENEKERIDLQEQFLRRKGLGIFNEHREMFSEDDFEQLCAYVRGDTADLSADLDEEAQEAARRIRKALENVALSKQSKWHTLFEVQQFMAMRRASITASVLNVLRNKVIKELGGSVSLLAIQEDIHTGRWSDEAPSPLLALPPEILCRIASLAYDYNGPLWPKPSKLKAGSHTDMNG